MSRRPPTPAEWRRDIGVGYPIFQAAPGHLLVVGRERLVQARCTCGWAGPDRSGDPHMVGLVVDDVTCHCHRLGVACPDHEPVDGRSCSECERRDAFQMSEAGPGGDPWWQRL